MDAAQLRRQSSETKGAHPLTDTTRRPDDAPPALSKDTAVAQSAAPDIEGTGDLAVSRRTVTINRPRAEVFAYWRDFANLASFMENIERIDVLDSARSHWVVKAPAGRSVEWDAVVTEEADGRHIAWTAAEGADVRHGGRVEFNDATGGRGTTVTAVIAYDPPAGKLGQIVAKLFQREPSIQARRDLRRFKQLMETGEIATSSWTRAQRDEEKE